MLPSAAVVLRTSVRLATSNSHTCVRARPDLISMPQPRPLNNSCPRRRFLAQQRSAREIVAQTISSIGSKRDTAAYLKVFTLTSQHFAVIKVGGRHSSGTPRRGLWQYTIAL